MSPSTQLPEDSLKRNDVKVMTPTATLSNIPLPGTVPQEKQTHLSCVAKIDEEYGKEIQNNFRITDERNQRPTELNIFPTKQPYIPYALAKAYITKNDYSSKIKTLRVRFEAYQEQVNKKNRAWKDTKKILEEKTDELMQEKDKLLLQVNQEKEKWEKEKSWLLETFAQTLDLLHTHHSVTVQKLKATRLALENIQEILKFPNVQKNESLSSEKVVSWISSIEAEPEFTDAFEKGISKMEDQRNLLLEEKIRRALELLEKVKQSLQKQESEIVDIIKNGSECRGVDSLKSQPPGC
uniref:Centrosome-associated protein CEP250-like n=1 Tax=Phascolarctos cinereus TaxID=38626 RepID=A0A6P5M9N5_PHACI|nr:centrosome-associated protein CEP250-like [Phascolarctos cinereus]